jgi:hypothetical protein
MEEKIWFCVIPHKLTSGEWCWLRHCIKTIDDRPVQYLGLLEEIRYHKITNVEYQGKE